jgi:glycosyltransferase involved in cell wall biosynthesis
MAQWLAFHVRDYDALVVHGTWGFPVFAAAFAAHLAGVPYILFPHGTLYKYALSQGSPALKRVALMVYVRRVLEHAASVVFASRSEAEGAISHLQLSIASSVIPNMVDSSDFRVLPRRGRFRERFGIPARANLVIHFGRIAHIKGIKYSLRAIASLAESFPDLVFAIAGGDTEGHRLELELEADRLGIRNRLIFTGILGRADGIQALVDADVFVLSSHSENFGLAVVEAMMCGLPVVISDHVGIAPEVSASGAGKVFALQSVDRELPEVLATLLCNPLLRHSLGETGRRFAMDTYDVSAVGPKILRLIESICNITKGRITA